MESQQGKFEGWAIIEVFGHQKAAGFVTTENYGAAALFRCDTPELPEREIETKHSQYIGEQWVPGGAKVKRPVEPAYSKLIGPGAVFTINPCTEDVVRQFLDNDRKMPLIVLDLPKPAAAIAAPDEGGACFEPEMRPSPTLPRRSRETAVEVEDDPIF